MPMLSALTQASCPPDDALRLVTSLTKETAPTYYFEFSTSGSHTGEEYVLDRYSDFRLLPERLVDPNFLICRYERLFPYRSKPGYYCVSWMAVSYAETAQGDWSFARTKFRIKLSGAIPNNAEEKVPDGPLKLRLVTTGGATAVWAEKANTGAPEEFDNVDPTSFRDKIIELEIAKKKYDEDGIMLTVEDAADDKPVGRLRILFLKNVEVRAICLMVENIVQSGADFVQVRRMVPTECPRSLESRGAITNYAQGYITDDANRYGFGPIGVVVNFDATDIALVKPMADSTGSDLLAPNQPLMFTAESVDVNPDVTKPLSTKTINALLTTIQINTAKLVVGGQDRSKYSAVFILVTPFRTGNDAMGVSDNGEGDNTDAEQASDYSWSSTTLHNVTLLSTEIRFAPLTDEWKENDELRQYGFVGNVHRFYTLVHEFTHVLLLNHLFVQSSVDPNTSEEVFRSHHIINAHRWMRLYLHKDYVVDMKTDFNTAKVKFSDFKTGTLGNYDLTLFDGIIALGAKSFVSAFIDKIFPPSDRPASWTASCKHKFYARELVFWGALNDLVNYRVSANPGNIMNNGSTNYAAKPNSGSAAQPKHEMYLKHAPILFNRFQWEVVRRAAEHLQAIGPI